MLPADAGNVHNGLRPVGPVLGWQGQRRIALRQRKLHCSQEGSNSSSSRIFHLTRQIRRVESEARD